MPESNDSPVTDLAALRVALGDPNDATCARLAGIIDHMAAVITDLFRQTVRDEKRMPRNAELRVAVRAAVKSS